MLASRITKVIAATALLGGLAACVTDPGAATKDAPLAQVKPVYRGVETRLIEDDLVNVQVEMTGATGAWDVSVYATCAAAQYTLIRGYGYARHVRSSVGQTDGIWQGDAIFTISATRPDGMNTLDAARIVADCQRKNIPTV